MRIVLDTNCLIQSIPRKSPYRKVWDSIVSGENTLCITNEILDEYIEILQRLTDLETAELVSKTIIDNPFVEFVTPYYHFLLVHSDPDDNKFVDCAVAAQAHFIVTNDRHYDLLKHSPFPIVNIITLQDFSELI